MDKFIKFSIIIPIKNEMVRLGYCVPSILDQTFSSFELLLVDGPDTTDDTPEFLTQFSNDSRLSYFVMDSISSTPKKRNFGAYKARGEYLIFLDADMELPLTFLETLSKDVVGNSYIFITERTPGTEWVAKMKDFEKQIIQHQPSLLAARCIHHTLFSKVGGYDETLAVGEDMEFSDRLSELHLPFEFSTESINHYEIRDGFQSHMKKKFFYGMTYGKYRKSTSHSQTLGGKERGTSARWIYLKHPLILKKPLQGIQFILFKSIEMLALLVGYITSIFTQKEPIQTK